jgi:hypothetical protein
LFLSGGGAGGGGGAAPVGCLGLFLLGEGEQEVVMRRRRWGEE